MSDPVFTERGGENCPFYRDTESQRELLSRMVKDAFEKAVEEHDIPIDRIRIETKYRQGRREPHTSYAEVRVYDRYD